MPTSPLSPLKALLARAHVPHSGLPVATIAVLADGRWVPGVRVENASFPLTVPALTAALAGARALGVLHEIQVLISTRPFTLSETALAEEALGQSIQTTGDGALAVSGAERPPLTHALDIDSTWPQPERSTLGAAIDLARLAAQRARVPHSGFPVGCAVATHEGVMVPGVNVEFDDWTRGLCAERTALVLTVSYGLTPAALTVTCLDAPGGTPCGACRQVIAELALEAPLWIDQGAAPPTQTTAAALLPDAFLGAGLRGAPGPTSADEPRS
ncbi:MAG: cytidine deaminase [Bacteroidota bacterium]